MILAKSMRVRIYLESLSEHTLIAAESTVTEVISQFNGRNEDKNVIVVAKLPVATQASADKRYWFVADLFFVSD